MSCSETEYFVSAAPGCEIVELATG